MWMIHRLISIIFPSTCIGCGISGHTFCIRCRALARKSLSVPHPYIVSTFDFKDPAIKRAIHAIKYYHRRDLVPPLAENLANDIRSMDTYEEFTLVPIPMPRTRRLLRGYNQAELIAEALGKALNLPVDTNLLTRMRTSVRQATLVTRKDRLRNQKGTFEASGSIHGKSILLIDDVTTTGATLEEARNVLLRNGARRVIAATLAH